MYQLKVVLLCFFAHALCAQGLSGSSLTRSARQNRFFEVASDANTDKVSSHHYEALYNKYLDPVRLEPLRLLEVGLGCDMNYGPGHSLKMWTTYLPNSELSWVEYDATCAEAYRETIEQQGGGKLYVGDQANVTFLKTIIGDQAGRLYDVIIDDGGHRMEQQKTTTQHLWQLVKPGGIFVMEDLLTSYLPAYGGGPRGTKGTMIEMHKEMLDDLHCVHQGADCKPILPGLLDMDCFFEACVMVKEHEKDA